MSTIDAEVAIVGAGPVGLTLAIDLAARGRGVVMLETRARGEPPNVKCNHVAARTMEQFRRLGLAADVRGAGLPPDYPNDVAFRTSVTGTELSRIHIPARATATRTRAVPMAGGRRPSRRTASTRSISSRSCSRTPRRKPACGSGTAARRPASRRTSAA
jgi:choline dehydrogenase-like flavoprotein